jgi:N-acyl-D-aspartate/D-glutamate deacylase
MLDMVVKGGKVVDGTGAPARDADIGVRAGRIVAIGDVDEAAEQTIDADGRVVTPGFVDIHTHYDAQILWDPACTPSPLHGVTSVVGGNCGFTIAPIEPSEVDYITTMLARVEGMPLESLIAGVPYDWRSFGEYLDRIENAGVGINAGFLVGHCALRCVVMGADAVGAEATPAQLAAMCDLLGRSLAEGGLGFSSSQATTHNDGNGDPVPSRHASREEIIALARVVRDYPGTTLECIPAVGGFKEEHLALMTDMSRAANRPLNWNLIAPTANRADDVWTALGAGDYAAARGGKVLALTVPDVMRLHLTFKAGFVLDSLPGWAKPMALPVREKMLVLGNPDERRRLDDLAHSPEAGIMSIMADWGQYTVVETFAPENAALVGRTVGDIATERGQETFDALCQIAIADELRTVFVPPPGGDDDDSWKLRAEVWRDPRAVIGASDAGAHLDMLSTFSFSTAMLRSNREHGLLPLEEAVHCLTDVQARLYGLRDRGRIAEGWYADLVVLDADTVAPGPVTWRNDLPAGAGRLYAEAVGIEHVLVNGVEIVRGKELTGARPGVVLRSGRNTETVEAAPATV